MGCPRACLLPDLSINRGGTCPAGALVRGRGHLSRGANVLPSFSTSTRMSSTWCKHCCSRLAFRLAASELELIDVQWPLKLKPRACTRSFVKYPIRFIRGVFRGPYACPLPRLEMKKNFVLILCKKYAKIWTLLKMYIWNVPRTSCFQISK